MSNLNNPSLREIVGAPVDLPIAGRKFQVQPMGWYQASLALQPILPALNALPLAKGENETEDMRASRWAGVVMIYRDECAEFCALASGFPLADVKALPPTAFVELVMGLVEINADFFVQSLPEALKGAQGRLARLIARWAPLLATVAAAGVPAPSKASTTSSSA